MSKAEKYIEENTKLYSNISADRTMTSWLTPDQARIAVEIEREEVAKKAYAAFCKVCKLNCNHRECYYLNNFKQAMKDE